MEHGRPHGHTILYNPDGNESNVQSHEEKTETSGWGKYIGQTEDGWRTGQGKYFFGDGRVFNGEWEKNKMK